MSKVQALLGLALMLPGVAQAQRVTAVPKLEMTQFFGTWFEIARLPVKAQKGCLGNAFVEYAGGDKQGRFQEVSSCKRSDGTAEVRTASGRVADKHGDGRLKVTTIWPLSRKVWVLAIGPEDGWLLVGSPNRKSLKLLSKTAVLPADQVQAAEAQASAMGYKVGKLVMVDQKP